MYLLRDFLVLLSCVCLVKSNSTQFTQEPQTSENSLSDVEVPLSLQNVLNFYNSEALRNRWSEFRNEISTDCQKDVEAYLDGLKKAEIWALKMDDASGKYSTGWYWGNHYWLGSKNLCDNIVPNPNGFIVNRSRVVKRAVKKYEPDSPSQAIGYRKGPLVHSSVPPFLVSFYMLKIDLNSSFTSEERILSVGLCLPYICSENDVKTIMKQTASSSNIVTVDVIGIKSHYNYFNIFHDRTFLTLCLVTAGVTCCLLVGTLFDYYLEHQKNKQVARITQRYSMPSLKSANGKSGIYVVNTSDGNNNGNGPTISNSGSTPRETVARLIFRELILSFSVRTNMKTICDKTVGSDTIPVLHGLKSISMAWVILGHTCIVAFKYSDNMDYRKVVQKELWFQTITNGAFSVDTFFFVSGLLVSFLYFRTNAKGKLDPLSKGKSGFVAGLLHFWGLIFYRFARLTVPYLFSLGVTEVVMKWFYYNSVFEPPTMDHETCPKYWWRNILYINTLFPVNEMCMLWSWYLSDDTQFYAIGAVILILAASHFKSAASLLILFSVSSWITTGYIAYSNSHMPGTDDPLALFDKIYDKPWTRLGPYMIGMCVGWLLFKKDCRIPMSKVTVIVGWISSLGLLLALVYGLYDVQLDPITGAAYSSLSHSAWALGLAWIVVACVTGYGGIVNKILSLPILYPFSRVTYCAYLVHPLLIRGMVMGMDSPLHLGRLPTIIIYMGQVVGSYILSFVLSLMFEAPIVSMLRIINKIVTHKKRTSDRSV
ncbi:nose resistant to fluoxetine protein 6 isoform X2 [Euwallacea similis]|uniref:nose resistant to fluoxetine protein 6 isoform X2 n=1 Tax=Euwallacea similis TaxID=1736056 RepID=UPI00344DB051